MEVPFIQARIVHIKPGAEYQGRIYTQYIYLQFNNNVIIDVFDAEMIIQPDMLNSVKNLILSASITWSIKKMSEEKYEIEPNPKMDYHVSRGSAYYQVPTGSGHQYYGKIVDIDTKWKNYLLDVGVGTIIVSIPLRSDINDYKIGDFVLVGAARTDLDKILE